MHGRSMSFALILTLASFGCSDQILAPEAPSVAEVEGIVPLMAHVAGPIVLIGSTDEGELVRIDITGGTGAVTWLGDSGTQPAESWDVGWLGLAFGPGDDPVLYTLSNYAVDPRRDCFSFACSRIYSVELCAPQEPDCTNAAIIADHGRIYSGGNLLNGSTFLTDLDFGDGRWGALRTKFGSGAFAYIHEEPDGDFIYDPRYDAFRPKLNPGGLSYHPLRGEWWGVESGTKKPVVYRITTTGPGPLDSSVDHLFRLDSESGFSGMEITHDGRVFLSQDGDGFVITEFDPASGEIKTVDLGELPTRLVGNLTGLEELPPSEPPPSEPPPPTDENECKEGRWEAFGFKNQGQCVRFVRTGKDSR